VTARKWIDTEILTGSRCSFWAVLLCSYDDKWCVAVQGACVENALLKTAQRLADDEVTRIKHDLWRATQSLMWIGGEPQQANIRGCAATWRSSKLLSVKTAGFIQACNVRVYWPAPTTAAELAEGVVAFLGLSESAL